MCYVLLLVCIYVFIVSNNKQQSQVIEQLHAQNDSLYQTINNSNNRLIKLDSVTTTLKNEIHNTNNKLIDLQIKSKKIQHQYETEIIRINSLSNDATVREFTNTFN